jgi:hypothetical protein
MKQIPENARSSKLDWAPLSSPGPGRGEGEAGDVTR